MFSQKEKNMAGKLRRGLFCLLCVVLWSLAQGQAQAEMLTIGGTGSSGPLIKILFEEFRKQAPGVTLNLIDPPLGTNGALKALAMGRIHMVLVGRPLPLEDLKPFGQHFTLADTPFVMASRDGVRSKGFTLDELAKVYDGSLQKWDTGGPIRLVLRGSFESDTLLLKTMSTGLDKAVTLAGQRPGMAGAVNDIATAMLIANTPGSLGPTTLGLLTTLNLRCVLYPINGVAPSLANLKTGCYPWHKKLSVLLPPHPRPAAANFAHFLRSPKAQAVMLRNDYLPGAP